MGVFIFEDTRVKERRRRGIRSWHHHQQPQKNSSQHSTHTHTTTQPHSHTTTTTASTTTKGVTRTAGVGCVELVKVGDEHRVVEAHFVQVAKGKLLLVGPVGHKGKGQPQLGALASKTRERAGRGCFVMGGRTVAGTTAISLASPPWVQGQGLTSGIWNACTSGPLRSRRHSMSHRRHFAPSRHST